MRGFRSRIEQIYESEMKEQRDGENDTFRIRFPRMIDEVTLERAKIRTMWIRFRVMRKGMQCAVIPGAWVSCTE